MSDIILQCAVCHESDSSVHVVFLHEKCVPSTLIDWPKKDSWDKLIADIEGGKIPISQKELHLLKILSGEAKK